jgi:Gly-Xaa carboxypeptidase
MEKVQLPTAEHETLLNVHMSKEHQPQRRPPHRLALLGWLSCLAAIAYLIVVIPQPTPGLPSLRDCFKSLRHGHHAVEIEKAAGQCRQPAALFPSSQDENDAMSKKWAELSLPSYRNASIERLSGAVQVQTESFDDLGAIGEDPRWDVMYDFAKYLKTTFPLVHKSLKLEKVNTHGLLYTWTGSDESLQPTLLMAHQDVVPVLKDTISEWTHPPWSGYYDGEFIWGRGASDCKNTLIASLEAVTALLEAGFEPKRTVLLSFGFDEECSGRQGAAQLAPFIESRYGKDGVAIIVDEGSTFEEVWGTLFAKPGTGEKGYVDVDVLVKMPGGHSSIPADHTSIGALSEFIVEVESSQYETRLELINPYLQQLQCGRAFSPDFPSSLKKELTKREAKDAPAGRRLGGCQKGKQEDGLALEAARLGGPPIKYLMQTSQAVDIVGGGVKVNALPERAVVTINHRINVGDTAEVVMNKLTAAAEKIAKRHNLTVSAFENNPSQMTKIESARSITLTTRHAPLPVAPITPAKVPSASSDAATPFSVLAGTTRALYGEDVVVAPGIMTGNTDTRYYWDLTRHIFRFSPGYDRSVDKSKEGNGGLGKIHTVDERVSVAAHVQAVKWYWLFLRNMDEAKLE